MTIRTGILLGAMMLFSVPNDPGSSPVTPKVRKSVERAVDWLLRAQNSDGSWGDNPGMRGEVGNTCIATLALMATGSSTTRGRHWRRIRDAMTWLQVNTKGWGHSSVNLDNGTLLQGKLGQNIDLYLMTLLHSQAMGTGIDARDEKRMREEMIAAVNRISSLQKSNGEWETSYEPTLTTITAWLALRQAHDAGITIHAASPKKVVDYLKKTCLNKKTGVFHDKKWGNRMRFVTQAGGLTELRPVAHPAGECVEDW